MENTGDTYGGHGAAARVQLPGVHSCPSRGDMTTLRDLCLPLEGCKHSRAVPLSPWGHLSPNSITWIPPRAQDCGTQTKGSKAPVATAQRQSPKSCPSEGRGVVCSSLALLSPKLAPCPPTAHREGGSHPVGLHCPAGKAPNNPQRIPTVPGLNVTSPMGTRRAP